MRFSTRSTTVKTIGIRSNPFSRMARNTLATGLILSTSVGLLSPMTFAAPIEAPTPQPFGLEAWGPYQSDISSYSFGIYYDVVQEFNTLRRTRPDIMQSSLEQVVKINNEAASQPELIARAQMDARSTKENALVAFSDALGPELGQHLRQALVEGRLPKTTMLLGNGIISRAGGIANSTFAEKYIFDYDRPFVVAPERINKYNDGKTDYYGTTPAFPSGHTNQATWITTLLAIMLPEYAPQILNRGAEAGYHRLVMGVHYPLDVIGGRMTGTAAAADRWNDPKMRAHIQAAAQELRSELEWRVHTSLGDYKKQHQDMYSNALSVAEYTQRMHYGFSTSEPAVTGNSDMIVPQAAPDLLLTVFPELNYQQRASIIRQTALPAGYPLDTKAASGSWQRINLAAAAAAQYRLAEDGSLTVLPQ